MNINFMCRFFGYVMAHEVSAASCIVINSSEKCDHFLVAARIPYVLFPIVSKGKELVLQS